MEYLAEAMESFPLLSLDVFDDIGVRHEKGLPSGFRPGMVENRM